MILFVNKATHDHRGSECRCSAVRACSLEEARNLYHDVTLCQSIIIEEDTDDYDCYRQFVARRPKTTTPTRLYFNVLQWYCE